MFRSEEAREKYDGKIVVTIGSSNSVCEIVAQLANICAQVLQNFRAFNRVALFSAPICRIIMKLVQCSHPPA